MGPKYQYTRQNDSASIVVLNEPSDSIKVGIDYIDRSVAPNGHAIGVEPGKTEVYLSPGKHVLQLYLTRSQELQYGHHPGRFVVQTARKIDAVFSANHRYHLSVSLAGNSFTVVLVDDDEASRIVATWTFEGYTEFDPY